MSVRLASAEPLAIASEQLAPEEGGLLLFEPELVKVLSITSEQLAESEGGLLQFDPEFVKIFSVVSEQLAESEGGLLQFDPPYKTFAMDGESLAPAEGGLLNFSTSVAFPVVTSSTTVFSPTFFPTGTLTVQFPLVTATPAVFSPTFEEQIDYLQLPLVTVASEVFSPTFEEQSGAVIIEPEFTPSDPEVYEPEVVPYADRLLTKRGPLVKDWGDWTPATKNDVRVFVDGNEVDVASVNPYHGEIVLAEPLSRLAEHDVRVDYKWFHTPIMRFLLNTRGLTLNKADHRRGQSRHSVGAPRSPRRLSGERPNKDRFPFTAVLGAPNPRPKPLLVSHRYRGLEKAYTAALNSPTTLRLNNPNRVSKPAFRKYPKGVTAAFEADVGPSLAAPPWNLEGQDAGQVNTGDGTYDIIDARSESFNPEDPGVALYWRPLDLTCPSSIYVVGRFRVLDVSNTMGVFTGVGFGAHDNLRSWVAGALLVNGLEHVGLLLDPSRVEKVTSWKVGPTATATILSPTTMRVPSAQVPFGSAVGQRFQILSGTQSGVYKVLSIVHENPCSANGTTVMSVSPAFPANFNLYGNQYPELVWETLWSQDPVTYRLEIEPSANKAILKVSGSTASTVVSLNGEAPLLAKGSLVGQTAVTNLFAGTVIGTGPGRVQYEAVPKGLSGNGISVAHVDPGTTQHDVVVDVADKTITVTLSRSADVPGTQAGAVFGSGNSGVVAQASAAGVAGNSIRVAFAHPGIPLAVQTVGVAGTDITVNLATDGSNQAISTANAVADAINAHPAARLLINATGFGTGLGVVAPQSLTNLTGGVDLVPGELTATAEDVVKAIRAHATASGLVTVFVPTEGPAQVGAEFLAGGRGVTTQEAGQVFFGSLGAQATNRTRWSFLRYGVVPSYSTVISSSQTVAAEMDASPDELEYNPWFTTQQFGYARSDGSELILKSTSNHPALDFSFGFERVEPFLSPRAFLDVQAAFQIDSGLLGAGDGQIVLRDGQREIRVSTLLYREGGEGLHFRELLTLPSVSLAGLLSPSSQGWESLAPPTASAQSNGPVLSILQDAGEHAVFQKDIDLSGLAFAPPTGRIFEARLAVLACDPAADSGIRASAEVGGRTIEIRLIRVGITPRVGLYDRNGLLIDSYTLDWEDRAPHTYRVIADPDSNVVSLSVDETVQLPTRAVTDFAAGSGSTRCTFGVYAGVATETEWYSVSCQVTPPDDAKRTLGVWRGGDVDDINNWELPRTDNTSVPNSMEIGPVIQEMDWRSRIELRIFKSPQWGVTVYRPDLPLPPYYAPETPGTPGTGYATQTSEPSAGWINVETPNLPRAPSLFGSVSFGALDPRGISQQVWSWMRYRLYGPPTADHRAPQGMVLNRANVVTSGDVHKDITLEVVTVPVTDPRVLSLWSADHRARDVLKIVDGTTAYVRDSWVFDPQSQEITLNDGLAFQSQAVSVTFIPGRPSTRTYLADQPLLDGAVLLNEGTPPVPRSQTVETIKAEQALAFPALLPNRVTVPAYAPNSPSGIPDSVDFAAADTNQVADFVSPPEALYQRMEFLEITDGGERGLIASLTDLDSALPEGEVVGLDQNGDPAGGQVLAVSGSAFADGYAFPTPTPYPAITGSTGQFMILGGGNYVTPVISGAGDVVGPLQSLGCVLGPQTTVFHPLHPSTRQAILKVDVTYADSYAGASDELIGVVTV